MRYTEFYDFLKDYFTEREIVGIQMLAFREHKDAHGFYPMRKEQKQFAYGFLHDFLFNNIIDVEDCYHYLKTAGCTREHVELFWKIMEETQ